MKQEEIVVAEKLALFEYSKAGENPPFCQTDIFPGATKPQPNFRFQILDITVLKQLIMR